MKSGNSNCIRTRRNRESLRLLSNPKIWLLLELALVEMRISDLLLLLCFVLATVFDTLRFSFSFPFSKLSIFFCSNRGVQLVKAIFIDFRVSPLAASQPARKKQLRFALV